MGLQHEPQPTTMEKVISDPTQLVVFQRRHLPAARRNTDRAINTRRMIPGFNTAWQPCLGVPYYIHYDQMSYKTAESYKNAALAATHSFPERG